MANRFLLPNTAGREFKQSVKELFELDRSFLQQVRALCQEGTQDGSQMSDRLVRIHLLEDQIQAHLKGMSSAEQTYYRQLLPINRKLVSELEQINAYLRSRPQLLGTGYSQAAVEVLDNLEDAILRVQRSYTARELEPFLQTDALLPHLRALAGQPVLQYPGGELYADLTGDARAGRPAPNIT